MSKFKKKTKKKYRETKHSSFKFQKRSIYYFVKEKVPRETKPCDLHNVFYDGRDTEQNIIYTERK